MMQRRLDVKMTYVEPAAYFTPGMKKILEAGEAKENTEKVASKKCSKEGKKNASKKSKPPRCGL